MGLIERLVELNHLLLHCGQALEALAQADRGAAGGGRWSVDHLLSAARSELFNRVLGARVHAQRWDTGLDGEVWMLDGSRSVFMAVRP